VAWQQLEDDRCPGCGNLLSETTDFALRTEWQIEKVACHGCRSKSARQSDVQAGEFLLVTRRGDGV
jgi:hypothetical protein